VKKNNKVAVFLATGFEEIEAVNIIDVLRRGNVNVDVISVDSNISVEGSHGIVVKCDYLFYTLDCTKYDMLILPGGMPGTINLQNNKELCNLILEFNKENKFIGAICAAPRILGELHILEGKEATCYPGNEKYLKECNILDEDVVVCNNIITGKGPGVAIKFALEILKLFIKNDEVIKLKKSLIM